LDSPLAFSDAVGKAHRRFQSAAVVEPTVERNDILTQPAAPEFLITAMRQLTMPEITFFYVTNQPTVLANLDRDLDLLLDSLYAAKAQAGIAEAGPDITRYNQVNTGAHPGEPDLFLMEVGIPVKPGTSPAGEARIKTLPPFHCAGLLLWGSLAHVGQAYDTLKQEIQSAGLKHTGESREWNYRFESLDSPINLMGLYMGI
jgi:effector-binding domain-containing protein